MNDSGSGQTRPYETTPADDFSLPHLPPHIGRYRIERVLGEGGFGRVYLAYDESLQRPVAVKVPHHRLVPRPEAADVYLAEARTVASLDHPSIVPVHDVGRTDDCPCYVVSKYIDGTTLANRIKQAPRLTLHEAVNVVATVAEAVHYAHTQGLVHRDIKPGNILLDRSGKPFATDFGLALREKDIGTGPRYAGTPMYMSPEQARGEGHRVDARSDVFSLGVVLYELITGRRPFLGKTHEELLEQIATADPPPPRQIVESIPPPLERVCLKAMAKRAAERYATAQELADDLRIALDHATTPTGVLATDAFVAAVVPKGLRAFEASDADFFLDLLPGPRDRQGLPEAIRFWKSRLEQTDPEATFSVGLLYGPSGCGKSSLVQAGLLPRLAPHVVPVYLEATADLPSRLLHRLARACPGIEVEAGLARAMAVIRRGEVGRPGEKVVIVLDQFEQWLHAQQEGSETELIDALRQCDGGRLQCLVLVRDDFWMMSTRFLRAVEVGAADGHSAAAVDLFTPDHTRRVLTAFGRAYGTLPAHPTELTAAQTAFLDRAVEELTEDGWVVPVRLALFADMVKRRPWTVSVLRELGGTIGVGVTFLDESFTAPTAPPEHRHQLPAVKAVLRALLPEAASDIRGHARSCSELLDVSGYREFPGAFIDLLRILIADTRLLTPVASDGIDEPKYQFTHDYLIPSVREWLARKQLETRRGRAEARLAERGALWRARPEQRQLPSLAEWVAICLWTRRRTWTDSQRQMMRAADRYHLLGAARLALAAAAIAGAGWLIRTAVAEERAVERADGVIGRLLDAHIAQVPAVIDDLAEHRAWANPRLEQVLADPAAGHDRHIRARLALLPVDLRHRDIVRDIMLNAGPDEFVVLRDALAPYREELTPGLWDMAENPGGDRRQRMGAAAALATYDLTNRRWDGVARWVARQLAGQPSLLLAQWVAAFQPVRHRLAPELADVVRERSSPAAAEVLGNYAYDRPDILAEALAHASPDVFTILFARLQDRPTEAIPALTGALVRLASDGDPEPNRTASARANLALALHRLGRSEQLWPLMKASPEPRARSFIVDRLARASCDPAQLLARLDTEQDDSTRAALLLGLGGYDEQALPPARRAKLLPRIRAAYREEASAEVHAAAHWLLARWGETAPDLPAERDGDPTNRRKWYVNAAGQTMIRVNGPVTFLMGHPSDVPGGSGVVEKQHTQRIDYSYDIGMTEVTVDQYRRFAEQRGFTIAPTPDRVEGDVRNAPVIHMSWYDAAAYCNWLSAAEGIPPNEWCYAPNSEGRFASGMRLVPGYRTKRGYRLPTEAEWEYACRGGAITTRCYGDAEELLTSYARYAVNSHEKYAPVATLLPNAYGLFDVHGNSSEWCQDEMQLYGSQTPQGENADVVTSDTFRVVRSGHILHHSSWMRSARRLADRPSMTDTSGLRIARSRP